MPRIGGERGREGGEVVAGARGATANPRWHKDGPGFERREGLARVLMQIGGKKRREENSSVRMKIVTQFHLNSLSHKLRSYPFV